MTQRSATQYSVTTRHETHPRSLFVYQQEKVVQDPPIVVPVAVSEHVCKYIHTHTHKTTNQQQTMDWTGLHSAVTRRRSRPNDSPILPSQRDNKTDPNPNQGSDSDYTASCLRRTVLTSRICVLCDAQTQTSDCRGGFADTQVGMLPGMSRKRNVRSKS